MKYIQIKVEENIKDRYKKLSKHHGMTLISYIKMLLAKELDKYNF